MLLRGVKVDQVEFDPLLLRPKTIFENTILIIYYYKKF